MEHNNLQLTLIDHQIMNSYCKLIDGLADYLGKGYEIVLHTLENYEHSVIYIINGEHTGRKIGAPITNKALEMLNKFETDHLSNFTYYSVNKQGEPLKSTTIAIRGENNRIIGLLCMNFYMNTGFYDIISEFFPGASHTTQEHGISAISETFANDTDEMILSILSNVKEEVNSNPDISPSNKNKAIIALLSEKGVFQIKDAVIKVAGFLGISKNTVYLHLRNLSVNELKK